jgi:ribosomal protein L11 methyltransferase
MKYYEVKFTLSPLSADACDLLAALAGDAGFETFEETTEGICGYVQQQLFERELLDALLQDFPLTDVTISYTIDEAEDRDWNEQWEQEGFEPIIVNGTQGGREHLVCGMVIHDGRHLPTGNFDLQVEIDAHLAFGTGTHETTQMVCATLLDLFNSPASDIYRVLDCGCGTGILGITAMKLGAQECIGYDIDEWSVDNTRHNAVINQVEVTPLHGDASILNKVEGRFDLVMANINRNILLQDMPMFREKMAQGARLVLSGFYTDDIALLTEKAATLGLSLTARRECNEWACIVLQ